MTVLHEWAVAWGVPPAALTDLTARLTATEPQPDAPKDASEAWAASVMRQEAAQNGVWLTRNNVGVLKDKHGTPVRFGLANESKAQNAVVKSGDYIGLRPVVITPAHVGHTIGQFVSRETKHANWTYKGDAHETAQLNWALLVQRYGGDAQFATGLGSFSI